MELLYKLYDNEFPKGEITHTRSCARAIILNDKDEVCMIHILADDIFGHRDYFETPGGGVNEGEDIKKAVIREAAEETGYICEIIAEIGIVDDYYNLIKRHNLNHYFLLRAKSVGGNNLDDYEKEFFDSIKFYEINEAIRLVKETIDTPISKLVKQRELPIYELVRDKYLKKNCSK